MYSGTPPLVPFRGSAGLDSQPAGLWISSRIHYDSAMTSPTTVLQEILKPDLSWNQEVCANARVYRGDISLAPLLQRLDASFPPHTPSLYAPLLKELCILERFSVHDPSFHSQ